MRTAVVVPVFALKLGTLHSHFGLRSSYMFGNGHSALADNLNPDNLLRARMR